jgi:uncharacterized protein (DUF58 family)
MTVTRRFLLLNAPGLAFAAAALWFPGLFVLALGYHAAVLLLAVSDAVFGHDAGAVTASRHVGPKLSLGDETHIEVEVANLATWPVSVTVVDQPPEDFRFEAAGGSVRLPPRGRQVFRYAVTPPERGTFSFGDLWLRVTCRMGLAARRLRIPAAQEVRVYPNLAGIRRAELLGRKNRLAEVGIHRVRVAGQGTEFEQLREYSPDDDYRRINWKATAKRSKPTTMDYQLERSQNVLLCVDAGYMMGTELGWMTKLDVAINAGALLAHAALSGGDRVGLVVFSHRIMTHVTPAHGSGQMNRLMEGLQAVRPEATRVDYLALVKFLAIHGKRRSLLAIFTDLADTRLGDELVRALKLLRARHLPLCLTFRDEQTEALSRSRPGTIDDVYTQAVAMELARDRTRVLGDLTRQGAHVVDTRPDELSIQAVNAYLSIKARQIL